MGRRSRGDGVWSRIEVTDGDINHQNSSYLFNRPFQSRFIYLSPGVKRLEQYTYFTLPTVYSQDDLIHPHSHCSCYRSRSRDILWYCQNP
jgi:hypothetical protein